MTHSTIIVTFLLSISLAVGCDKASDDAAKTNNAQTEANRKIEAAKAEAYQKGVTAQAEADRQVAEANTHFLSLREDYRNKTTEALGELDRKVAALEASAKETAGAMVAGADESLRRIRAKRADFMNDYKMLEAASAATWDDKKSRLDKELSELRDMVSQTEVTAMAKKRSPPPQGR